MILMADLKNVYKTKVVPHTMPHPQKERDIQTKRITTRFLTFFNYCVFNLKITVFTLITDLLLGLLVFYFLL